MFNQIYKGKTVVVTGHTGFKGAWMTSWLLKLGAKVIGISIDIPTKPSLFETMNLKDKITDYRIDVREIGKLKEIILNSNPDFLFHLAAQPIVSSSYLDPLYTFSTNVMGTVNVLESLRYLENKCVAVIVTSDKCYDNVEWVWGYKESDNLGGKDIYSGSKGAAELVFKSYYNSFFVNHKYVTIASARAGNVIGGGDWAKDRIVPDCMNAWNVSNSVEIRSPKATRPWQHVLEPISGYLNLAHNLSLNFKLNGESFNFGPKSEHSQTVVKLLEDLSKYWKLSISPYKITDNIQFHEASLLKLNCDKSLFYLKWVPVLEYPELIEFTSKWYFEFFNNNNSIADFTLNQISDYEKKAINRNIQWTI